MALESSGNNAQMGSALGSENMGQHPNMTCIPALAETRLSLHFSTEGIHPQETFSHVWRHFGVSLLARVEDY